jgi:hypothetical protein
VCGTCRGPSARDLLLESLAYQENPLAQAA